MDYAGHYERLIARARDRTLVGYKERHHILPRCMGGTDTPENLVDLTAEEHYVAHQLLVKMNPCVHGLAIATVRMAKQCTGNKAFGWLRRRAALAISAIHLGVPLSAEHVRKVANALRGQIIPHGQRVKISQALSGRSLTQEHRQNIGKATLGRQLSLAHRQNIAKAALGNKRCLGRKHSEETKAKIGAANSKALRGIKRPPRSPEHQTNLTAALRAAWARRKANAINEAL